MRVQNIILFLSILLLSYSATAQDVDITNPSIEKIGDRVTISFDANIDEVSTDYMLTLTPTLWSGAREQSLSPIVVMGRRKSIMQARKGGVKEGIVVAKADEITSYKVILPFGVWMGGVSLRMDRVLEGCCGREVLAPISIVSEVLKPTLLPVTPLFRSDVKSDILDDFQQIVQAYPFLYLSDTAADPKSDDVIIYFKQGSTTIDGLYQNNSNSLRKIQDALALIKATPNMNLTKITIVGVTSPEGSFSLNKRIGQARAESLVNYLSQDVDSTLFNIGSVGENWDGLYSMVEQSNMAYRNEVLSIIDSYGIFEGREKRLMNLRGGSPYMYMLKEFFPGLRKTSYVRVFYGITPNDEFTKTDKASQFIKANSYNEALQLLQEIAPTPYTENLMGVCYMMLEDAVNARLYLQRAIDGGNGDAPNNLEQLNYQRDNIQYK